MTSTPHTTPLRDEWRDARLRKALENAPDAQARPDMATREAILHAAHAALRPACAPTPWWKRWLQSGYAQHRMPWNAAFVTILAAGCIGLLWTLNDPTSLLPSSDSGILPAPRQETAASPQAASSMAAPAPAPAMASRPHADARNAASAGASASAAPPFDAAQIDVPNSGIVKDEDAKSITTTPATAPAPTAENHAPAEHAQRPTTQLQAEHHQHVERLARMPVSPPMPPAPIHAPETASGFGAGHKQPVMASPVTQRQTSSGTASVSPPSGELTGNLSGATQPHSSTDEFSVAQSSSSHSPAVPIPISPAPTAVAPSRTTSASEVRREHLTAPSTIAQGQSSISSMQADDDRISSITSNTEPTFDIARQATRYGLDSPSSISSSSATAKMENNTIMGVTAPGSSTSRDSISIAAPLHHALQQWDTVAIRVTVNGVSSSAQYTRSQAAPLANALQQTFGVVLPAPAAHNVQQTQSAVALTFAAAGRRLGTLTLFELPEPAWRFTPAPGPTSAHISSGKLDGAQWRALSIAVESLTRSSF